MISNDAQAKSASNKTDENIVLGTPESNKFP
jgi:hypothetical protein